MRKAPRATAAAILAAGLPLLLAACQTTTAEGVKPYVTVVEPSGAGAGPRPVVFFLQGTGGGNNRANLWAKRLAAAGIASAIIDDAALRGRSNLAGVAARDVAGDYAAALRLLRADSRVDVTRHAVMGFSSGGTAAMLAGSALADDQPRPRAAIAFYPGAAGDCAETHTAATAVHVFYGDLDEWGAHKGTRDACRRMAEGKPARTFHLVKGAQHGFDDTAAVTWPADGRTFRSEPNPQATEEVARTLVPLLRTALE